jgi:hypothetical protein
MFDNFCGDAVGDSLGQGAFGVAWPDAIEVLTVYRVDISTVALKRRRIGTKDNPYRSLESGRIEFVPEFDDGVVCRVLGSMNASDDR